MKYSTFRTALLAFSGAALLMAVLSGSLFAADFILSPDDYIKFLSRCKNNTIHHWKIML